MTSTRTLTESIAAVRRAIQAGAITVSDLEPLQPAELNRLRIEDRRRITRNEVVRRYRAKRRLKAGLRPGVWPEPFTNLYPKERTRLAMLRSRAEARGEPTDHLPPRVRKRNRPAQEPEPS